MRKIIGFFINDFEDVLCVKCHNKEEGSEPIHKNDDYEEELRCDNCRKYLRNSVALTESKVGEE